MDVIKSQWATHAHWAHASMCVISRLNAFLLHALLLCVSPRGVLVLLLHFVWRGIRFIPMRRSPQEFSHLFWPTPRGQWLTRMRCYGQHRTLIPYSRWLLRAKRKTAGIQLAVMANTAGQCHVPIGCYGQHCRHLAISRSSIQTTRSSSWTSRLFSS